MFFSKLLPQDGNFFDMLSRHADCMVEAAKAYHQLVTHYADPQLRAQYSKEVDAAENKADTIVHEVNMALHKTFITPIDREQIHRLTDAMDDVADLLQDCAETMALYDVEEVTPDMLELTEVGVQCCERVREAVQLLPRLQQADAMQRAIALCGDIDKMESQGDHILRQAMSRLFREEQDTRKLIKFKAIYELLETVTDCCEDVANLIEGIVLENS